ncbi:hypothetical protein [Deinococcus planocerae]|uniref:hypothetical protein n=1 Tax=Deinococcus planocerae TaxID=1737569 RepID=UPI001CA4DF51|nr:hypothetical protein [Deinococcus planocerae]
MPDSSVPLASFTLTRYAGRDGVRGFTRMGLDRSALAGVPGLTFRRLLGTGRGQDLSLGADFLRWARFCVWSSREAFEAFEDGPFRRAERERAQETYTLLLRPTRVKGRWGGVSPFGELPPTAEHAGPVAVLTRAAIRPTRLLDFWRAVPESQGGLHGHPALLASVGVGEVPLLHQATFSLWRDAQGVRAFAYGAPGHRSAIRQTRARDWYGEELFARFVPLRAEGTWDGRDPLAGLLPP